jgi:hypothetical protein
MSYTIIAATYANADHTSAVVQTMEAGAVAISAIDTPEDWAGLATSGVLVLPYVAPDPVPDIVSTYQAKAALMQADLYDRAAAAAQSAGGLVALAWATATEFRRASPTIAALTQTLGLNDSQVDDLFRSAVTITA